MAENKVLQAKKEVGYVIRNSELTFFFCKLYVGLDYA
jgi:hypothetical protein